MEFFENELKAELKNITDRGLHRRLRCVEGPQGPELTIDGKTMLVFASNNYLGLANHPRLIEQAVETTKKWGTGSGASRLITGNTALHQGLEKRIARFKGQEKAILFNTGYMANLGVLTSVVGPGDTIFSDELNHASIIDGTRSSRAAVRVYKHNDMDDLGNKLKRDTGKRKLIVTDGLFSMDGDLAPLPELVELKERHGAVLMVDDAHGTGVLGDCGTGIAEHFHMEGKVDINMGTLSKALGTEGGFVAGEENLINFLRNRARTFIFSTAIAPGSVGAALAAFDVLADEPWRIERLRENARFLRRGLGNIGLNVPQGISPIIPVIIGSNEDTLLFGRNLEEQGIFVPAIRPPSVPENTGRLRVTVMATHTREQLERALAAFEISAGETEIQNRDAISKK